MRFFAVIFGLIALLISCQDEKTFLNSNLKETKNATTSFDSVLQHSGKKISDSILIQLFIKSDLNKLWEEGYEVNSEAKWGIYISSLTDFAKYETPSSFTRLIVPERYKILSGGIEVPIYSSSLSPYLVLSLLKFYDFYYGLTIENCIQMYSENKFIFSTSKDTIANDLFTIEFLFKILLSEKTFGKNREKYISELNVLKEKYPMYRRFSIIMPLISYANNKSESLIRTTYDDLKTDQYQLEYFIQNMLSLSFDKNSPDTSFQKELLTDYDNRFNYCQLNYLRFYNGTYFNIEKYKAECLNCISLGKNYDSSKSLIYLALLYMHTRQTKSLDSIIDNYSSQYDKNSQYYLESEERMRESGMYNILELRSLLFQKRIEEYLKHFKLFSGKNVFLKLDFSNYDNLRSITKKFYLLDINSDSSSFQMYFEKNILPVYR